MDLPFIKLKECAWEVGHGVSERCRTHPAWAKADQKKVLEMGMVVSWKSLGWGSAGAAALEASPTFEVTADDQ